MILQHIHKTKKDEKIVLTATIVSDRFKTAKTIFFRYPEDYCNYIPENADPFFPGLLIPCMFAGENLEILPPLSEKLMKNQSLVQDIFLSWHPEISRRIDVKAKTLHQNKSAIANGNATFFSLGVDSMYSLLRHLSENSRTPNSQLKSIIYMKGMELPLSVYTKNQDGPVIEAVKKVAQHYNVDAIIGETNLRDIFPLDWEDQYFGPGLASTALSLSLGFKNIFIPSSHSYNHFFHDPSSPLLDHLWSTEQTRIFHDGAEKERAQKIADLITHDSFALNNLRVCTNNEGGILNCGMCPKCIRTMITLEILGLLESSDIFPKKLPRNYTRQLATFIPDSLEFTRENLKLALENDRKDIARILQREIRIGKLDCLRNGDSLGYVFREVMYYYWMKAARKLGLIHR